MYMGLIAIEVPKEVVEACQRGNGAHTLVTTGAGQLTAVGRGGNSPRWVGVDALLYMPEAGCGAQCIAGCCCVWEELLWRVQACFGGDAQGWAEAGDRDAT